MMRMVLLLLLMKFDPGFSAELNGEFVRVNGTRFFVFGWQGKEIYVPSGEIRSEEDVISQSFCKNHLRDEDIIKLRTGEMSIRDESLSKLLSQCTRNDFRPQIPEKKTDQATKSYDFRNAGSLKSVLDYLIKK